ncbi:hypothetical protein ERJ75_000123700 [Trypanosoma vivax]|nr:hypothetical protein ERJ75_000123700 [Trypanosoma vivax]
MSCDMTETHMKYGRHSFFLVVFILCLPLGEAESEKTLFGSDDHVWHCQWLKMNIHMQWRVAAVRKLYVVNTKSVLKLYEGYVDVISENEAVRSHESVLQARNAVSATMEDFHGSSRRVSACIDKIYRILRMWGDALIDERKVAYENCPVPERLDEVSEVTSFIELWNALNKEFEAFLSFTADHGVIQSHDYIADLRQLVVKLREKENFFGLCDKIRVEVQSVVEAQKNAKKSRHRLDGKMAIGCEVERKLSVILEIFAALENVANATISREAALQKRIAKLTISKTQLPTIPSISDAKSIRYLAESAALEANTARRELTHSLKEEIGKKFNDELGSGKELEVGGEKCTKDTREEQKLLSDAGQQWQQDLEGIKAWKSVMDLLWEKVKNVDNIVQPNCEEWKRVDCNKLVVVIRNIVERCDTKRVNVGDKLTSAIKTLIETELAVIKAELEVSSGSVEEDLAENSKGREETTLDNNRRGNPTDPDAREAPGSNEFEPVSEDAPEKKDGIAAGSGKSPNVVSENVTAVNTEPKTSKEEAETNDNDKMEGKPKVDDNKNKYGAETEKGVEHHEAKGTSTEVHEKENNPNTKGDNEYSDGRDQDKGANLEKSGEGVNDEMSGGDEDADIDEGKAGNQSTLKKQEEGNESSEELSAKSTGKGKDEKGDDHKSLKEGGEESRSKKVKVHIAIGLAAVGGVLVIAAIFVTYFFFFKGVRAEKGPERERE